MTETSTIVRAMAPVIPTALVRPVADGEAGGTTDAAPTAAGATWGISAVGADASQRTGAGVRVAVLDTGIDAGHPAFAGVALQQQDFTGDGDGDVQAMAHVAGTVFGRDVDGTRIGAARGVTEAIIGKVLGDDGSGGSGMLFRGIQWAAEQGAQIITMSLGFDFPGLVKRLVDGDWPADLATSRALEGDRANLRVFDALMQLLASQAAFTGGAVVVAATPTSPRSHRASMSPIAVSDSPAPRSRRSDPARWPALNSPVRHSTSGPG